jgi:uncharacterized protein YdiU (UPF0061 family)
MYGKLQPGLSEDELNKLIKEVLKKMNKTELDLKEAYRALERDIRWEESTLEEYLQDMRHHGDYRRYTHHRRCR